LAPELAPRFRIAAESEFGNKNEIWATCADIKGFFMCPDNPEGRRFIGLIDAAVSGPLLEYCAGRRPGDELREQTSQTIDIKEISLQ
jgi:hypothetical protein